MKPIDIMNYIAGLFSKDPRTVPGSLNLDSSERDRINTGQAPADVGPNEIYRDPITGKSIPQENLVKHWYGNTPEN